MTKSLFPDVRYYFLQNLHFALALVKRFRYSASIALQNGDAKKPTTRASTRFNARSIMLAILLGRIQGIVLRRVHAPNGQVDSPRRSPPDP